MSALLQLRRNLDQGKDERGNGVVPPVSLPVLVSEVLGTTDENN
jgi:hypothetical protein